MSDDLEAKTREAHNAARLLADETLDAAFKAVEQEHLDTWRSAASVEEREAAWYGIRALDALKSRLHLLVERGQVASTYHK